MTGCNKQDKKETNESINYEKIAYDTMNNYYQKVFNLHSNSYCGEIDNEDTLDINTVRIKKYNSIDEINNQFKKFLSNKFIKENLDNKFIEKDGKLYCKIKGMAGLEYNKDSLNIDILNKEDSKITLQIKYETLGDSLNAPIEFKGNATIIKENDIWVLDTYEEKI